MNGIDQRGHQIIRHLGIFSRLTGCQRNPRVGASQENVLKYWEKDKIQCIIKIKKNPEFKIKTAKIEATEKKKKVIKCI